MTLVEKDLETMGQEAKAASRKMAFLSTEIKNRALFNIAEGLMSRQEEVLEANRRDYQNGQADGMSEAMLDRLLLNQDRLTAMASDVRGVAALSDPIGEAFDQRRLPNGMQLERRRVPLGVIGAIYESRPNVTVDISVLCLKSGNAVILRGGSKALHSSAALARLIQEGAAEAGVPEGAVQFVTSTDRTIIERMLKLRGVIDLMIPRGSAELISMVTDTASVPVLVGGIGVCHTYVDCTADLAKAVPIAYNAKVQRPTVCNALDTLLVHRDVARECLPLVAREWGKAGVKMHCDESALAILKDDPNASPAAPEDWGKEFLSLVASVKIVDSLDEALDHIARYGSGHSDAIITEDYSSAMRFLNEVDAAVVYVNASTRFTDGGQFGLGVEVAISTQKLHARGPMGLRELTTYKWTVLGSGQIRV